MHIALLSNPNAGRGRSIEIADRLAAALQSAGDRVSREIDPADRPDAAIVIGGDGTLRHAAGRLLATFGTVPPLLIIPGGTANLMATHLKLKWNRTQLESQVIATLHAGQTRELDAATANGELFLCVAGAGFDAAIVAALDRLRTGPITRWHYLRPAIEAIWKGDFSPITVNIDGRRAFGPKPGFAFVGNIAEYGFGFPVLRDAKSDDGLLDVFVMPCASHEELIKSALTIAVGEHPQLEGAIFTRATSVEVASKNNVPVQLDGDPGGVTPLRIELLPNKIPFLVQSPPVPSPSGRGLG